MAKKKLSRNQKRKQKKRKRALKPRAGLGQSWTNQMRRKGITTKLVRDPAGEVKMSAVLRQFVDPYWHIPDDQTSMNRLLATALVAWNTALQPEEKRSELLAQVAATLPSDTETQEDFYAIVAEMMARKEQHFAQYDRVILDYELIDQGDNYHLSVIATISKQ